jgi:hypothetical protein
LRSAAPATLRATTLKAAPRAFVAAHQQTQVRGIKSLTFGGDHENVIERSDYVRVAILGV